MCQLLNPFSCHPPFWLTHLSLSHQLTTTLKPSVVSWGSYCWVVVCGRTTSPCPHTHSTNILFHFMWGGKRGGLHSSTLAHPHAETNVLSSPHAQVVILHFVFLTQRVGRAALGAQFLLCVWILLYSWMIHSRSEVHMYFSLPTCCSVYMFPCPGWESDLLFQLGLCISPYFNVEIRVVISPRFCLLWVHLHFWVAVDSIKSFWPR